MDELMEHPMTNGHDRRGHPVFSWFASCRDTIAERCVTIEELISSIREPGAGMRERIAAGRKALAEGRRAEFETIKKRLPAVTLSGSFFRRQSTALEEHSGLLAVDIDKLPAEELGRMWEALHEDPHVRFAFRSPSGQGIKIALAIPVPEDGAGHEVAFLAAERYFRETYRTDIDPSGKDVARLCFLSHDPEAIQREDAKALDLEQWQPVPKLEAPVPITEEEVAVAYPDNDAGRAARFCDRWKDEIKFIPERKIWLTWDRRWRSDTNGGLKRRAITLANEIMAEIAARPANSDEELKRKGEAIRGALKWGDESRIRPMLAIAQACLEVHASAHELDANPWLLGTPNAVIDLKTGEAREHDPENLITLTAAAQFDAGATCPRFERFIEEVFPDADLRRYFWKTAGYSITGLTSEKVFHFLIGTGNNGKSKLTEILARVLGDYAGHAAKALLCSNDRGAYPLREAAAIVGKRLLIGEETSDRERLNVPIVKTLTGNGDRMNAAHLYENQFSFVPTAKLLIMGNYKPAISDGGEAMWRRVRLIPFERVFSPEEQDRNLGEKLKAEASGILNWLIEGALLWQQEGLEPPAKVLSAVSEYRSEQDALADFIADCVEDLPGGSETHASVFNRYRDWAEENGVRFTLTSKMLAKKLRERGWVDFRSTESKTNWPGITLQP